MAGGGELSGVWAKAGDESEEARVCMAFAGEVILWERRWASIR